MPTRGMVDENYRTAAVHAKRNFINTVKNSQWTVIPVSWTFTVPWTKFTLVFGWFPQNEDFSAYIRRAVSRISFCWLIFQGFSRLPENPISRTHAMSILQRRVRSAELANKSLFEVIELDAGWCTRVVSQLPVQIGSIRLRIRTWKATRFFTTNQLPDQMPYSTCQTEANLSPANNRH